MSSLITLYVNFPQNHDIKSEKFVSVSSSLEELQSCIDIEYDNMSCAQSTDRLCSCQLWFNNSILTDFSVLKNMDTINVKFLPK